MKTHTRFSIKQRAKSFHHAGRGISLLIKNTHNAWVHFAALLVVIILGALVRLSGVEWSLVILASGLVLSAEAFNTAIEVHMNLTSPEFHPFAKDTKDIAAGAVLISAITAFIIGLIVFIPHFI